MYIYIYIYSIMIMITFFRSCGPEPPVSRADMYVEPFSEGGTIRLGALIELKFLNYIFSSSSFSIRAFRVYPLIYMLSTIGTG